MIELINILYLTISESTNKLVAISSIPVYWQAEYKTVQSVFKEKGGL